MDIGRKGGMEKDSKDRNTEIAQDYGVKEIKTEAEEGTERERINLGRS